MTKRNTILLLLWLAILCWIAIIFSFSSETIEESRRTSGLILEKIEPILEKVGQVTGTDLTNEKILHVLLRKNAHVFNYFLLTLLLLLAFKVYGLRDRKPYVLTWLLATLCSMADEYYQTFVPGRGGEWRDVLIDNLGILMGMALFFFLQTKIAKKI